MTKAEQPGSTPVRVKPEVIPNPAHQPRRTEPTPTPKPVKVPEKVP